MPFYRTSRNIAAPIRSKTSRVGLAAEESNGTIVAFAKTEGDLDSVSLTQALVQLTSSLAWPMTAIVLALIFRRELRRAAGRLSSLSYGKIIAQFNQDLSNVEKEVKELTAGESVAVSRQPEEDKETLTSYDRLKRIAEISPRAAIMEAWTDIELSTKKVADAYGISTGQIAGGRAISELVQKHLLPRSVISVYDQMRRLRSRAAHVPDFAITSEGAEQYIDNAFRFHNALLFLLQQARGLRANA